jgi:alpha-beta hydrolase superfamily lysophospholipase
MKMTRPVAYRPGTLRKLIVAAISCLMIGSIAYAQRPKTPPAKKGEEDKAPTVKKGDAQKRDTGRNNADDRTEPQLVNLQTEDGVLISATYFPPLRPGKDVAPVMLLHGLGEKESIFFPTKTEHDLAFALQDHGYAVLTFDFRGHGHSTRRAGNAQAVDAKNAAAANKLDFHDLHTAAQFSTLLNDIETAKRFLLQKNNAGELNVGKLAVVGTEMGASLAVVWAFRDWQYSAQAGFAGKQGQDVQALVLVSPQYNFKGIAITNELSFIQKQIPIQVVVGKKDDKSFGDAKKIHQASVRARPKEADSKFTELNTAQRAGKLLNPDLELDVEKEIASFLDGTVKKLRPEWSKRELAEGDGAGP